MDDELDPDTAAVIETLCATIEEAAAPSGHAALYQATFAAMHVAYVRGQQRAHAASSVPILNAVLHRLIAAGAQITAAQAVEVCNDLGVPAWTVLDPRELN